VYLLLIKINLFGYIVCSFNRNMHTTWSGISTSFEKETDYTSMKSYFVFEILIGYVLSMDILI